MNPVLAMRLAVYGMVALLAVGVLAMRATREPPRKLSEGALYHGQTPEGLLAALSVTDGKVREAYFRWRMSCEKDRAPEVSTLVFKPEYGDRFEHDGRRFSTDGHATQDVGGGERISYDVHVRGQLSEDGRSASGSGQTVETWTRNGRVTDVCYSKRVPWTVHRGMVVKG
ncbi:MAG TPA: hypothetical protein VF712_10825 [Thermoleophilaceae bacterium]|jgi:hypothetical protein